RAASRPKAPKIAQWSRRPWPLPPKLGAVMLCNLLPYQRLPVREMDQSPLVSLSNMHTSFDQHLSQLPCACKRQSKEHAMRHAETRTATDQDLQSEEMGLVSPTRCSSQGAGATRVVACQLHGKENSPVWESLHQARSAWCVSCVGVSKASRSRLSRV